ncbi:MAG: hypothetical protein JXA21_10305 [Anaerolineae bacterium]|nr:hypothetical protein [Anaerolineae bacterium]
MNVTAKRVLWSFIGIALLIGAGWYLIAPSLSASAAAPALATTRPPAPTPSPTPKESATATRPPIKTEVVTVEPEATPESVEPETPAKAYLIPLIGVGLTGLVAALCALGFVLIARNGRLKAAYTAAFSMSKWRVQLLKLNTDLGSAEKQKDKAVEELGTKAWQLKASDPAYAQSYELIERLEGDAVMQRNNLAALEQQVQEVNQQQEQIRTQYGAQLKTAQEKQQEVQGRLNQIKAALRDAEHKLGQTQKQQQQTTNEVRTLEKRLSTLQASTAPDKETQSQSISDALAVLQQTLSDLDPQITTLQAEIEKQKTDQQPVAVELTDCEAALTQLQRTMQEALAPGDNALKDLQDRIKTANESLKQLQRQQQEHIARLGPQVNAARPAVEGLQADYDRVDQLDRRIADLTSQVTLRKAHLATLDKNDLRRFYLMVLLGVSGVVGLVGLGFSITKLLGVLFAK